MGPSCSLCHVDLIPVGRKMVILQHLHDKAGDHNDKSLHIVQATKESKAVKQDNYKELQ